MGQIESFRIASPGLAAVTMLLFVVGCGWFQEPPTYDVVNQTDQTLVLIGINSDGVEVELIMIEPGGRYVIGGGRGVCAEAEYVVHSTDGQDYARQPHQLCTGDVWIITAPDS
ncbi:MAG TPA: hypothetical protein VI689_03190 [Acidimicrobiia bacterium]|nr:hypothetical protein [Acidimicrobiia bacterium]